MKNKLLFISLLLWVMLIIINIVCLFIKCPVVGIISGYVFIPICATLFLIAMLNNFD